MNGLILHSQDDGRSQIKLRAKDQTVWLTQLEMAELFDATKQNISLHLKNIFEERELDPATAINESLTIQIEGSRKVQRPVNLYKTRLHSGRGLSCALVSGCAVSPWLP